jgi:UDP-N-acetylglucosamine diphosphorylase / glucose-1-phosphate thymidylyltransferase / UDP-N-acetylgalactosamine diphosphorylase / glucosamine-1-phosphate N-acetyltransferase / galactosamine-1-phosphate N-acetyltransferase
MILIENFIKDLPAFFAGMQGLAPWKITADLPTTILEIIKKLDHNYVVTNDVAIHTSAIVEEGAVLKGPAIISEHCFIGAHAYLRGGVYLCNHVSIGTGCEIKQSIIFPNSSIAHFNFIGDSIIGSRVNFEAGSITANHFNERENKNISIYYEGQVIDTACNKFGSLVGDQSKVGANAVLSPGTILKPGSIVKRLELINQQSGI